MSQTQRESMVEGMVVNSEQWTKRHEKRFMLLCQQLNSITGNLILCPIKLKKFKLFMKH